MTSHLLRPGGQQRHQYTGGSDHRSIPVISWRARTDIKGLFDVKGSAAASAASLPAARGGGAALFSLLPTPGPLPDLPQSARRRQGAMSSAPPPRSGSAASLRNRSERADARRQRARPPPGAEGDTSARRPLCQPRRGDPPARSHSHDHDSLADDGCGAEGGGRRQQKERSRCARSKPPLHQHRDPGPRRTSPSHPTQTDDAASFFGPGRRAAAGSSSSLSGSEPPGTAAPRRPAACGRASKRLSVSASECDSSLHPIVKSVFGQVREVGRKVWRGCV